MRRNGEIIERTDLVRARRLLQAPNATAVIQRSTGALVGVDLRDFGRSAGPQKYGNPRKYSHDRETRDNPQGCWTLKRIPTETADIFGAVVNDCVRH